jgi:hypothetical protein
MTIEFQTESGTLYQYSDGYLNRLSEVPIHGLTAPLRNVRCAPPDLQVGRSARLATAVGMVTTTRVVAVYLRP